jgi:hypothetical protein
MNQPPNTIQQRLRDKLLDAVAFRIGQEVEDTMPADISPDTRKAILAEITPHTRFTMSRLTTDELQNDRCIEHEIQSTLRIANGFVDRIRAQRRRSQ